MGTGRRALYSTRPQYHRPIDSRAHLGCNRVHHNRFGRTSHTEKTGLPAPVAPQEENDGYYRFLIPLGRVEVDPNMRWSRRLVCGFFLRRVLWWPLTEIKSRYHSSRFAPRFHERGKKWITMRQSGSWSN